MITKFAVFWVETDNNTYQLGIVAKLFNLDEKPQTIKSMTFERSAWRFAGDGSYHIRNYDEGYDQPELIVDGEIGAGAVGYLKKRLPIVVSATMVGGEMPDFAQIGRWYLTYRNRGGDEMVVVSPPVYSVYPTAISESEWDDLLKPKSKIEMNNLRYDRRT